MEIGGLAANIIGITAFVFASSTVLVKHLLPYAEELLPDEEISQLREVAFFSVSIAFLGANFGVAIVYMALTSPIGMSLISLPSSIPLYIGGLILLGSVSAPCVGVGYVGIRLYQYERSQALILGEIPIFNTSGKDSGSKDLNRVTEDSD